MLICEPHAAWPFRDILCPSSKKSVRLIQVISIQDYLFSNILLYFALSEYDFSLYYLLSERDNHKSCLQGKFKFLVGFVTRR